MIGELLNFKQGRIADSRENVEILQQKVEQHENQISQQTVFSKIESLDSADNLYHMCISVNDGSGSLEVVDKADEDTSDGKMSVVGLNMYKSSIASLMNDVNELKSRPTGGLSFSVVETETEESGTYQTVITNNDSEEGGEIEIIDTLGSSDKKEVLYEYYVFLDENDEIVPLHPNFNGTENGTWISEIVYDDMDDGEAHVIAIISNIEEEDYSEINRLAQRDPAHAKDILRMKDVVKYERRTGKYLLYLDEDGMLVPEFDNETQALHYSQPWTAELEQMYAFDVECIKNHQLDEAYDQDAQQYPDFAEDILRQKSIVKYEVRGVSYEAKPDKKMSVVGLNMYKSSIASIMNDVNELKNNKADWSAVEIVYPTVSMSGGPVYGCGSNLFGIFLDTTPEVIEFYQNNPITFNLHLKTSDQYVYDGVLTGSLNSLSLNPPYAGDYSASICFYPTDDPPTICITIGAEDEIQFVFDDCTVELVPVLPFAVSIKTTINNKEYEVPTLKAFNELKQRIEALENN